MKKTEIYKELEFWLERAEVKINKGHYRSADSDMRFRVGKYIEMIEKNRLTKKYFDKFSELDFKLEEKGF